MHAAMSVDMQLVRLHPTSGFEVNHQKCETSLEISSAIRLSMLLLAIRDATSFGPLGFWESKKIIPLNESSISRK